MLFPRLPEIPGDAAADDDAADAGARAPDVDAPGEAETDAADASHAGRLHARIPAAIRIPTGMGTGLCFTRKTRCQIFQVFT